MIKNEWKNDKIYHNYNPIFHIILIMIFIEDTACQSANTIYNEIVDAFIKKDCQAAALFIGALMHVIADATFYPHVLAGASTIEYQFHVLHVTFRTWDDVSGDRSNEFFNLEEASGKLTLSDILNPYVATLLAGKNTRFGSLLYQDAEFLHYSAPSALNRQFWVDVEGAWVNMEQQHTWTHLDRPSVPGTSAKKYFDTIEHNLNQTVYYCATVLNWVLNFAGYTDCECDGSSSGQNPNPPPPDGDKEGIKDGIQLTLEQFESLFYFNMMGFMATAIAIALLNKYELLEEIIPI